MNFVDIVSHLLNLLFDSSGFRIYSLIQKKKQKKQQNGQTNKNHLQKYCIVFSIINLITKDKAPGGMHLMNISRTIEYACASLESLNIHEYLSRTPRKKSLKIRNI